jgi:hypothetical protein
VKHTGRVLSNQLRKPRGKQEFNVFLFSGRDGYPPKSRHWNIGFFGKSQFLGVPANSLVLITNGDGYSLDAMNSL